MNNKEISSNSRLPVYEVEEMSMLDAMILLKRSAKSTGESSISRAAERLKPVLKSSTSEPARSATGR